MTATALKSARMELKTTADAKELLNKAALLDGMDLSSFVMSSAIEKARKVLLAHAAITLSKEGQLNLARLVMQSPKPTKAMKDLMALPPLPQQKK
ncbi:hypothetical protein B9Z39_07215 [Limnohabitans sp. JirII-29]|uniref:type II toxin-antitoxin system TacA family antitoxin n=1 Tax=unclassified Limnohabitans TaxID=2626134 RepID=UPI000D38E62B|nr:MULTISPECIES: DUF1778 domain-containing protein [unclassified Limnohabitans]PUE28521.1 hypothetical protein B9Z39_07215 [Limnohabitans sp. JirII-29]